jgi:hypothetical protein
MGTVTFEHTASSFLYRLGHTSRSLQLTESTDALSSRYLHVMNMLINGADDKVRPVSHVGSSLHST